MEIRDPALLAEELRRIVDRTFGGNESSAARHAGLSQPTLNRLCRGVQRTIRPSTLEKARSLIPDRRRRLVDLAVRSPAALHRLEKHSAWLAQRYQAIRWDLKPETAEEAELDGYSREQDEKELVVYLWKRHGAELRRYRRQIERRGHLAPDAGPWGGEYLFDLSIARIIAPLLEWWDSGGIERHWTELSAAEVGKFVRAGIRRERLLLDRPPAHWRANQATGPYRLPEVQAKLKRVRREVAKGLI